MKMPSEFSKKKKFFFVSRAAHVNRLLTCAAEHVSTVGAGASHGAAAARRQPARRHMARLDAASACFKKHAQRSDSSSFFLRFLLRLNSDFESIEGV